MPIATSNKCLGILICSLKEKRPSIWNDWLFENIEKKIWFSNVDLSNYASLYNEYNFTGIFFHKCHFGSEFAKCIFERSIFYKGKFPEKSKFPDSIFKSSRFQSIDFTRTNFWGANLRNCEFRFCNFVEANLMHSSLVESKFYGGKIIDCKIYGANIWDIDMDEYVEQRDLIVPYQGRKKSNAKNDFFTIDNLQVGNVIYLLLDNTNYKKLFDESKKKTVLLLGRFGKNLPNLEKLKQRLRQDHYSPVVFDFPSIDNLDLIEAIILLSFLSKFIIVDLTDPKSVPAELQAILTTLSIPIVPIMQKNSKPYGTFSYTAKYGWVLPIRKFEKIEDLIKVFKNAILDPAEELSSQISKTKKGELIFKNVEDFEIDSTLPEDDV